MPNLLKQAEEARATIKVAQERLNHIQNTCSHPLECLEMTNRSVDGYAERPRYWEDCECGVCGKIWQNEVL